MRRRLLVGLVIMAAALAVGGALHWSETGQALAEPQGFASPINGGCYIAAPNVCKIHIDPFTININDGAGARLELFQLYANGSLIYDFRPDVSNPPAVDYSPSLVMQDFAARCGATYYVNMIAKDSTDANPLNYGQTAQFTCPAGVP
jgi:hypothetical protein